LCKTKW